MIPPLKTAVALTLALTLTSSAAAQAYPRAGFLADIDGLALGYGVSGQVSIVDADTLLVENFTYDGTGFSVFFYLGATDTPFGYAQGLQIGPQLVGTVHTGSTFTLDLPPGTNLDSFNAISVWCVVAGVSFGSNSFTQAAPTTYCTAKVNSAGCVPQLATFGLPSETANSSFMVTGSDVLGLRPGTLAYGYSAASMPFQGGLLCIGAPVRLTTPFLSNGIAGGCNGMYAMDFNAQIQSGLDAGLTAGTEVFVQYLYRDRQSPSGFGLSNAASFFVGP